MDKVILESTDNQYQRGYYGDEFLKTHSFFDNLIWLTTDDAARFLRKSTHAIRQMAYKGIIRPRKLGGRLYFKKSELDQLLDTSFY